MPQTPQGPVSAIVATNVQKLRTARGLSRPQLAALLSERRPSLRHTPTLFRIEEGTHRVCVDDLVALAEAFDVRPEQLLEPYDCPTCHQQPPEGFTCRDCGLEGV